MSDRADPEIILERRGAAGLIILNRPKALNALTLPMIQAMHAQLRFWETDEAVTRIVVRGAGGRAFCAGGDIRQIYELGKAGHFEETLAFWLAEYQLDAYVKRYPKPYVALIEGVVMGGGVGISVHGDIRVASEKYMFAMPETGIGYFPDVGMTYALPRLPGRTGTYLAVTGARVGASEALALGLATHSAKAADFEAIVDALAQGDDIEATLAAYAAEPPGTGPLVTERSLIDECFSADSVHDSLGRLDVAASSGASFAAETAALIRSRSPTSVLIAFEQMRRGVDLNFEEAMLTEYRLCTRVMRGHDFYEGVRSVIVDKDGKPSWQPATLDAVDMAAIATAFEPIGGSEPSFA